VTSLVAATMQLNGLVSGDRLTNRWTASSHIASTLWHGLSNYVNSDSVLMLVVLMTVIY